MVSKFLVAAGLALASVASASEVARPKECRKLKDIYKDPKEMCELMWDNAFKYVARDDPDYDISYTMWFFDAVNPNNAVTEARNDLNLHEGFGNIDVCHLDSLHKEAPTPEPDTFTECHPWRDASCCSHELDLGPETLNTLYGDEYRWDKCGPISQECERFFVQEGCFYQCDPNIGIFRAAHPDVYDENNSTHPWKVFGMPIKGDYCDSWYAACAHDYFCVEDNKNFFSCPLEREMPVDTARVVAIILGVVAAVLFVGAVYIVFREKRGQPIFLKKTHVNGVAEPEGRPSGSSGSLNQI